jgi:hypothetical protein
VDLGSGMVASQRLTPDGAGHLGGPLRSTAVGKNDGAGLGHSHRRGPSDTRGGPGDEDHLACEIGEGMGWIMAEFYRAAGGV